MIERLMSLIPPLSHRLIAALLIIGGTTTLLNSNGGNGSHFAPGERIVSDAHNCYPYQGRWRDRIDRALSGGFPIAIEQDLYWYTPVDGRPSRSVVAHNAPLRDAAPGMEQYFFDRVRPIVEAAIANPDHSQWPIITLNLDIKTQQPEHLRAIRSLLQSHQAWLTTAPKSSTSNPAPLKLGPILVLNGPSDTEQQVFYDELPPDGTLVTFGAVHTNMDKRGAAPEVIETEAASNYRRWWNNPWNVIEVEGQPKTGLWTPQANQRLKAFVRHAHQQGLWIRFYTLDGDTPQELDKNGWFPAYNFPSARAVEIRWKACIEDGVDYIATDEYEQLSRMIQEMRGKRT